MAIPPRKKIFACGHECVEERLIGILGLAFYADRGRRRMGASGAEGEGAHDQGGRTRGRGMLVYRSCRAKQVQGPSL